MASVNFGCSQQDLYTGGRIEWQLYAPRWKDFNDYSPNFTKGFGLERIAEIDANERLLDRASRSALSVAVTQELKAATKDFLHHYLFFKSYVQSIYDPSVHELKMAAIGDGYYAKAAINVWGNTASLSAQAIPYLENNFEELMSKGVIPASFPDKFKAAAKAHKDKYAEFFSIDQTVNELTAAKNNGDAVIYGHITNLNRVAQIIYKNNAETADLFAWTNVLDQIQGVKNAGAGGKVTIEGTKDGRLDNVKVGIVGTDKTTVTDSKGRFNFSPLSAGKYTLTFEEEGYEAQTLEVAVNTGITSRVNVAMKAIVGTEKKDKQG